MGLDAGIDQTTGSNNVYIGSAVGGVPGEENTIHLADNLPTGAGQSACFIGGIAGQTVGAGRTTCHVDNDGKLGVVLSARRFKTDIADMGAASEALPALRPVTFHYKPELDKTGIPQFGLVAEEVEKVNPDLITRDRDGKPYTVRYEAVNAMLLNEFLKAHRQIEEQQKEVEALRTLIQKVSDKVEMNKPAPQTVLNQ